MDESRENRCSASFFKSDRVKQRTVYLIKSLRSPDVVREVPIQRNGHARDLEINVSRSLQIKFIPGVNREWGGVIYSSEGASTGRGSRSNRGRRVRLSVRKNPCWS